MKIRELNASVIALILAISMLPSMQWNVIADDTLPVFEGTKDANADIYNDFEGEFNTQELSIVNQYNTVVGIAEDNNHNHIGRITTSSSSGVTFSGLWHYGVISPKGKETFDASKYADGGKLRFYIYSEISSRVYVGVKANDTWSSYQGFTDANSSTQSAGRTSGRLQETTSAGNWKTYELELSDFDIEDWSAVQGIAIGFYATGTYYIDNVEFSMDSTVVTTYKYEAEDMQLNHMRFPTTNGVSSGQAVGVYWSNNGAFRDTLEQDSFARVVLEAKEAGEYDISMQYYAGEYPIRIYVNGEKQIDEKLPGNGWASATAPFTLSLSKGKNVVIFAVAAWGCFDGIYLPSTLKVVENKDEDNTYSSANTLLQSVYLEPSDSLFDPEAKLYTGALRYDSSDDYISKVIYNIAATEGKSMTIHYYVSAFSKEGTASLACAINDNAKFYIDLEGTETNHEYTVTIDGNEMASGGLMDGNNEIVLMPVSGSGSVGIYSIELQDDANYIPVEKITKTGVELKDMITYRGRSLDIGNSVTFDWSGSGFAFNYEGSGDIIATMTTSGSNPCRIAVYVDDENRTTNDDEIRVVKSVSSGTSKVVLAKNLPQGHHTIEVVKCTEANGSLAQLDALTYNADGELSKWKDADYNMLVIGGSVSCGNQIYADGTEDASLSYVANLALAYNMNWNTISCSGRGIIQGYNSEDNWAASKEKQLISLNKYTSFFREPNTLWDNTKFTPDVIIVNAGGNDLGDAVMQQFGTTVDDFCDAVIEFSTELKRQYPNAMIGWFYGVYVNRAHKEEFQAAIDSMNDPSIQLIYTPQMNSGAANHPDVTEHMYVTQIMSERISAFLGVENPLPIYNPNNAPIFERSEFGENDTIYNDFEGEHSTDEITVENTYNTNLDIQLDNNLNHECLIKLNQSNGDGVNFQTMWHYGIVKPKSAEVFDASDFTKDGKLSFYAYSTTSSNAYFGVKINGTWYPYQGYTNSDSATQTAARNSGRLQDMYTAGAWQKFEVNLSDFNITDWSKVEAIGIGFYTCGDYYIDNITFEGKTVEDTSEITSEEPSEVTTEDNPIQPTSEEPTSEEPSSIEPTSETPSGAEPSTDSTIEEPTTTVVATTIANNDAEKIQQLKSGKVVVKKAIKKKSAKKVRITLEKTLKVADGYQVCFYKTKKNAKKHKKTIAKIIINKNKKVLSVSNKKLKGKKALFICVRSYAKISAKTYYGKWSMPKKVKIK